VVHELYPEATNLPQVDELLRAGEAIKNASYIPALNEAKARYRRAFFDAVRECHSRIEHSSEDYIADEVELALVKHYEKEHGLKREPDYDAWVEREKLDRAERNESDRQRLECERGTL
jgi:hypothetical protein